MTDEKNVLLETAKDAARIGGKILLRAFGKLMPDQIGLKGRGDYVTDLDRRSERAIISRIKQAHPDHAFLSEESGEERRDSPFCWIIDPLDGTANYVQGIPMYAVSVAVKKEKEIVAGVVYDPEREEMLWAVKDGGAYLNGRKITVSSKTDMAYSMLASGFPWRSKDCLDPYMDCFKELFLAAAGIRRMGSAAIDLAYTAVGRFDGFWEMRLGPWDIAAGILILKEAGGVVTDFRGGEEYFKSGNVVAGNPAIQAKILEVTQRHLCAIG
jgi:myo-inositol-1(or 4)-monophosphatase